MNFGRPYIIGETAFHHEGDARFLERLIKEAAEMKVNAVKFHLLLEPESYMISNHKTIEIIRKWIFSPEQWTKFFNYAESLNLDIIALCNDVESIDFIRKNHPKIKAIEIHASGLNDYFLLKKAARFSQTVILGIGGSTLDEIHYAIEVLNSFGKFDIFLMYGFQSFPTDYRQLNLIKMLKLSELFSLPVGYADHTDPNDPNMIYISAMPANMGINVLEKHITHVFGEKRTDYHAAANKEQIRKIKQLMELYEEALGTGNLSMPEAEIAYGNTGIMKKAIVAKTKIKKGNKLSLKNLWFKRTNESSVIRQNQLFQLIGLEAISDIEKDEIISFSKLRFSPQQGSFAEFNVSKSKE